MALFDKDNLRVWLGIGIGAGSAMALPIVAPVLTAIGRPLLKAVLSRTLALGESARDGLAEFSEVVADVVAEVRAEAEERALAQREALTQVPSAGQPAAAGPKGEPN